MPFIASRGRVRSNEPDVTININERSKSSFFVALILINLCVSISAQYLYSCHYFLEKKS